MADRAFNRKTELYVGIFKDGANASNSGYLIDNLHYEFEIDRSTEFYKDTATFTIYSPNRETIAEIMSSGCAVIFKAGYDNLVGTVFVGQIATAYPEDDNPTEQKLVLICNSQRGAQYPLQRTYITKFFKEGESYYAVLKAIADYVGVPLSGAEVLKSHKLDCGYIVNGEVRSEVTLFAKRRLLELGGKVIISNNEMIYLDKNLNVALETVYLSYSTGLVHAKQLRDEKYQSSEDAFSENMEYYVGLRGWGDKEVAAQKALEASVQPKNEVEFECLINPGIQVGSPIHIDARKNLQDTLAVLGKFYVTELHYTGDNFGGNFSLTGKAMEKRGL